MRPDVAGTAGAITGLVNTPASRRRFQNSNVLSVPPTITGTMGDSLPKVSKPSAERSRCMRRAFAHRRSRRSGSSPMISIAARTVAHADAGMEALKIRLRAVCRMYEMTCSSPATNPPIDANDLLNVPTMRSTRCVAPKCSHTPAPVSPNTPMP